MCSFSDEFVLNMHTNVLGISARLKKLEEQTFPVNGETYGGNQTGKTFAALTNEIEFLKGQLATLTAWQHKMSEGIRLLAVAFEIPFDPFSKYGTIEHDLLADAARRANQAMATLKYIASLGQQPEEPAGPCETE